jgi:hypothetical protein
MDHACAGIEESEDVFRDLRGESGLLGLRPAPIPLNATSMMVAPMIPAYD